MKNPLPVAIAIAAVSAALICISGIKYAKSDREAPVITFIDNLTYSDELTQSELLEGVSAYDSKEGDVSASLVIESITVSDDDSSQTVVYAARDSKNNVAKAIRYIR